MRADDAMLERLNSPDLATRVAARVEVIEANMEECQANSEEIADLAARHASAGLLSWRLRARLLAEARALRERNLDLIDQNARVMLVNQSDLAGR